MRILCLFQRCGTNHRIYRGFRLQRFAKGEHWECAERRLGAAGGYGEFFRRPFGSAGDLCQHSLSSTTSASSASICGKVFALSCELTRLQHLRQAGSAVKGRPHWLRDQHGTQTLAAWASLSIFCIGLRPSMGRQGERPGSAKLCMSMDGSHEARYGKADHGGRAALSLRRDADRRWLRIAGYV